MRTLKPQGPTLRIVLRDPRDAPLPAAEEQLG